MGLLMKFISENANFITTSLNLAKIFQMLIVMPSLKLTIVIDGK